MLPLDQKLRAIVDLENLKIDHVRMGRARAFPNFKFKSNEVL